MTIITPSLKTEKQRYSIFIIIIIIILLTNIPPPPVPWVVFLTPTPYCKSEYYNTNLQIYNILYYICINTSDGGGKRERNTTERILSCQLRKRYSSNVLQCPTLYQRKTSLPYNKSDGTHIIIMIVFFVLYVYIYY